MTCRCRRCASLSWVTTCHDNSTRLKNLRLLRPGGFAVSLEVCLLAAHQYSAVQVSEDPDCANSAQLAVLLRARLPPPHALLVRAATAYAEAGATFVDFT